MDPTRQQIIDALRDQSPRPIHSWAVEIHGRRYPLAQAWACIINESRPSYRAEIACALFERLGFRPFHIRQPPTRHPLERDDHGDTTATHDDPYMLARRLGALLAAIQFLGPPESEVTQVLETAQAFEDWLAR
jgi:hypothetical protein